MEAGVIADAAATADRDTRTTIDADEDEPVEAK